MPLYRSPLLSRASNYLFIDGGYLRGAYIKTMQKCFGDPGELDVRKLKAEVEASKAFYYDYDAVADEAGDYQERMTHLQEIQRFDGFHVRHGSVRGKWKRQKEVDVQLAVDVLGHAVRGNYEHATLVAGDLDFRPVVEELVSLGRHVSVYFERSSVAQDLAGRR